MSRLIKALLVLAVAGFAVFWIVTMPRPMTSADIPAHQSDLKRGAYLFTISGCASCHAAPVSACTDHKSKDKKTLAGGRCFKTQFGTFYAPNISSDKTHGIGRWSDLQFVNAMMRGVSPGGEHYYPAFPYTSYARMPIADVLDIKAYIMTLPAAGEPAPTHDVGFPFNVRRSLGGWKFLFFDSSPDTAPEGLSAEEKRGFYLVNGPAHCGECHTPRNVIGGPDQTRLLGGGPAPEGEGYIPNLTPHASGLKDWSKDDIVSSLETGLTPEFDSFGGSMVAVQENTAKMTVADRKAIAAYLKTVKPVRSRTKKTAKSAGS